MSLAFFTSTAAISWLLACAIKAALLLAASWLGAALLRRATAAARHQIWTLGVAGALLLPLLCWVLPSLLPPTPTFASTSVFELPAVLVTASRASSVTPTWPVWLAIVWTAGALAVAFRVVRGHLAARRLVRAATPTVDDSWSSALHEAAASLGLARRVELLRSEAIGSPMTIGVLRARVLLPAAAAAWSPDRLRAVLVHELGHVRRHDTAIQLAAQLACALYWWNPLAWLAATRLRIEREHACDDLVLGTGIRPSSYAADLLGVARSIAADAHAGAICMADRSWTEARLRRILDATVPRRPPRRRFRLAACGLAIACAAAIACTSAAPVLPPSATNVASPSSAPAAALGTLSVGTPWVRTADAPFVRASQTFGGPARQGALDLSLVATEVNRRLADLEQCYERRLAARPALSGTVVIHWVIAETGNVPDACITEDTVGDHELTACVNQLVLAGRFPAPRGGSVDVSMPFVFAPRASVDTRSQTGT